MEYQNTTSFIKDNDRKLVENKVKLTKQKQYFENTRNGVIQAIHPDTENITNEKVQNTKKLKSILIKMKINKIPMKN